MQAGEAARAARCAFCLTFVLLNKGALGGGGGWVHRAQRLLDEGQRDCVEQGYVCYCAALLLAFKGDVEAARAGFAEATKIEDRGDLFGTRQRGGHVEVLKRDKNTPGREAGETGVSGALMDMETLKQPAPTVLPNSEARAVDSREAGIVKRWRWLGTSPGNAALGDPSRMSSAVLRSMSRGCGGHDRTWRDIDGEGLQPPSELASAAQAVGALSWLASRSGVGTCADGMAALGR
jgi:hypothetical protein